MKNRLIPPFLSGTALLWIGILNSQAAPSAKDLNTPRSFPEVRSKKEWQTRAEQIREQVLVSCGLWPMPERTPLHARVFDRVERDGYTVEKVYFQSYPGVYVAGNLYRPLGKGKGPFPGVLNPHGHWSNGRMADVADGSVAGRCISQARLGMVAFSYDMTGYNDTFFPDHGSVPSDRFYVRHRRFATNAVNQLWSISQMGLQTWNSIRALDFLESLPDVDRKHLGCTGESGGGTQTFMLGAIDRRLAMVAPVVMVSHSMQGGCSCENAPGLRIEHSNMEISAAAAPVPQILVGATGDWTRTTLTLEGPSVARVYELLGVPDRIRYVRFDFNHNYNRTSREAVYGWMNKWLLGGRSFEPVPEPPFTKEPDSALRVFPDDKLPSDAVTENQLIQYLKSSAEARLRRLMPTSRSSLGKYRERMFPAWRRTLQLDGPDARIEASPPQLKAEEGGQEVQLSVSKGGVNGLRLAVRRPSRSATSMVAVLADGGESPGASWVNSVGSELLRKGWTVVEVTQFTEPAAGDPFANFYTVYNRTKTQERVRDLVRTCQYARGQLRAKRVVLCGGGTAGAWTLLAAPAADAVLADANQLDTSSDEALLHPDVFVPGLRNIGALQGPPLLAAPHPVFIHNSGSRFATDDLTTTYRKLGESSKLRLSAEAASPADLANWITSLR